eukprot:TRINITY_DN5823_c0_g1_i1.p1 TRINITY_DN5823_c0_g1~~TRINITY_DN5823_c0_g1_i1.p1  ORF type:complete len:286 (-),score=33.65 TRINITY_DN5823_c0_g1_i1:70-840(-)
MREWGFLYYNPDWTNRNDANTAMILSERLASDTEESFSQIVAEISDFYRSRKLLARLKFYSLDHDHAFKTYLSKKTSFEPVEKASDPECVMILQNSTAAIAHLRKISATSESAFQQRSTKISISHASNVNPTDPFAKDFLQVIAAESPWRRVLSHKHAHCFLLYANDKPVASLLLLLPSQTEFFVEVDQVETLEHERKKGYMTHLCCTAVLWALEQKYTGLFLWVIAENAKRLYGKLGFYPTPYSCKQVGWVNKDT